jgi:hypothetical protein
MTLLLNLKDCDVQRIVELLLDVGYRFTSHDRLAMTKGHIGSQVNDTLCRHLLRVPTLAHLCRLTVRRRVIASCRGQFVIDHIDRLPLPALLKDFVAFRADYALI